jgi:carbon storage regulator CsrA
MLVLSRKIGERIHIGNGITVTVVAVHGRSVRLGFEAPASVAIRREELVPLGRGPVGYQELRGALAAGRSR